MSIATFAVLVLVLDVAFLLVCIFTGSRGAKLLLQGIVAVLFPVGGVLFFALSALLYHLLFRRGRGELSIEDLSFRKYKVETVRAIDVAEELDRVPLAESLLVSNRYERRAALLALLKNKGGSDSMPLLRESLANEDVEVSHYAAVALNEAIGRFRRREGELYETVWYEEGINAPAARCYLNHTLGFLGEDRLAGEQVQYEDKAIAVLEALAREPGGIGGAEYAWVIHSYLRRGETAHAAPWVETALTLPDNLEVFKAVLLYYHRLGNADELRHFLQRIKASDVVLDGELLDALRFYTVSGQVAG